MPSVGDTVWLKNPNSRNQPHLYFVIARDDTNGKYILANMSSIKDWADKSCVLATGDHRRVTCASSIKYLEMLYVEGALLDSAVKFGQATMDTRATDAIIQRIQDGAAKSDFARPDYAKIIGLERNRPKAK